MNSISEEYGVDQAATGSARCISTVAARQTSNSPSR